jgi:hypothetical protein
MRRTGIAKREQFMCKRKRGLSRKELARRQMVTGSKCRKAGSLSRNCQGPDTVYVQAARLGRAACDSKFASSRLEGGALHSKMRM